MDVSARITQAREVLDGVIAASRSGSRDHLHRRAVARQLHGLLDRIETYPPELVPGDLDVFERALGYLPDLRAGHSPWTLAGLSPNVLRSRFGDLARTVGRI